jgi:hypothetical protein
MPVLNIHQRQLGIDASGAAELIDKLASPDDVLWPWRTWPPMRFREGLREGARGGHGPVRYQIESYTPGQAIHFRFTSPRGFEGSHYFELDRQHPPGVILRHVIDMRLRGTARLSWPLLFRPLHDALLEDALDRAETFAGRVPESKPYSLWVRWLRWMLKPRKAHQGR